MTIHWKYKGGAYGGHGSRVPAYQARCWVEHMNQECPALYHWASRKRRP